MLALLIYRYANDTFSPRRLARATYGDIGVRFVAANLHPDHDTIAVFRRSNKATFEAAFLQVLLLSRESGLLHLGSVSIVGTKIGANASKIRSVRYDRAKELRTKLAADIAVSTAEAEATDAKISTRRRCRPNSPGARRSRRNAMLPASDWRLRRVRQRRPVRLTRRRRLPMTRSKDGAAARRNRRTKDRHRNDSAV